MNVTEEYRPDRTLDCSALYTRKPELFKRALSIVPEYLRTAEGESQTTRDYMDYGIQLGRRFRALKLWVVIRAFGVNGLQDRIREHVRIGRQFAAWVDADRSVTRSTKKHATDFIVTTSTSSDCIHR